MKKLIINAAILLSCLNSYAQKKVFTTKDVELGVRRELAVANLSNLQWRGATENFTYLQKNELVQQSVKSSKTISLLSLDGLNAILTGKDTLKSFPYITWENENEFHFYTPNFWFAIHIAEKKIVAQIPIPADAANFKLFYSKKMLAYTIQNNVFIAGTILKPIPVTSDLNLNIVNGDIVSRNEFGINEGLFWSPKGNYLAFYRKDNSKVADYPLVDITTPEAKLKNTKYPMTGMPSEHVSLGIYNLNSGSTIYVEKDDTVSEKYLTNISWAPDEQYIYIQVLNRAQNHMKLTRYFSQNGLPAKTLFEEHNDKYQEPLYPIQFLNQTPDRFLYQSRRDGYNHIYLYDTFGKLVKQVTSGKWEVTGILSLDPMDNLFYTSTEESALEDHAYKLNLVSGEKIKMTPNPGVHSVLVNKNSKYCLDIFSNTSIPRIIDLRLTNGKLQRNVLTAENPYAEYDMPDMSISTIKAADGITDLYYRIIKPTNFDAAKKYPVIIYVYGGPHLQLITNRWLGGSRLWEYMMAQKGYIVFTVDNRGSANRGLEFENGIHRQCGQIEMLDQMEGVRFLKKQSFVDTTRIGVHGWSYGGFMTTSLMVNYPNVFKVGVAGGPVIDWKYYEVMYGERYMDTPQENPEGYAKTSLPPKAKQLKGKLLIIHGAVDPTVVWQNSLVFVQECIKYNIPLDYFVYPLAEHNVRGSDRVHLMQKITDYFDSNL